MNIPNGDHVMSAGVDTTFRLCVSLPLYRFFVNVFVPEIINFDCITIMKKIALMI